MQILQAVRLCGPYADGRFFYFANFFNHKFTCSKTSMLEIKLVTSEIVIQRLLVGELMDRRNRKQNQKYEIRRQHAE